MSWQRIDGQPILGQVTRLTDTKSLLYVERVTDVVRYMCIATNAIGTSAMVTKVNVVTCISDPPSMLQLNCRNGSIAVSWVAPKSGINRPLTAYYIKVNDMDSDITASLKIEPTEINVEIGSCVTSTVLLRAENDCGNSSDVASTIYVKHYNQSELFIT